MTLDVEVYEQPIEEQDYMVTLEAKFKPLLLSSMTKDMDFEVSLLVSKFLCGAIFGIGCFRLFASCSKGLF